MWKMPDNEGAARQREREGINASGRVSMRARTPPTASVNSDFWNTKWGSAVIWRSKRRSSGASVRWEGLSILSHMEATSRWTICEQKQCERKRWP